PDDETRRAHSSSGGSARREASARRASRISMAKKQVESLRGQVTRNRLELRELRVELRQRHFRIRQTQAQFWRGLQNQWNDSRMFDKTTLQQLYDDIQRALDELGPEEANYDEKEDDLDVLEYKLGKLEDRFYDADADMAEGKAGFASSSSSSSSRRSQSNTPTQVEDEASLNYRYLSRLGDANIVRERLEDLSVEKSQYVDLERDRAAMGLGLYKPNIEFLDTYEEVYAKNLFDLREIEEDLERLQNESRLTSPATAKSFETIDVPQDSSSFTQEHNASKTQSHRDSLRRKSDGELLTAQQDTLTVRQRVNQWILESLAVSAFERAKYRAMLHNPSLDHHTWWALVLDYWQQDQAAVSPPSSPSRQRGSKSPRSVSAQLQALSHSTDSVSKLNEKDIEVDAVDYPPDMSAPRWDTASKFPSKKPINDHFVFEPPSPRSLHKRNNYFLLDGCEIYSTSASY
ncbi:hypothetical protein MMC29_006006, partial [Sticta canariensis]|nr:hypothetical protein [Sticta canariensis]